MDLNARYRSAFNTRYGGCAVREKVLSNKVITGYLATQSFRFQRSGKHSTAIFNQTEQALAKALLEKAS